jgi:alginate O-acetyltransferase complex protein AlgI
MLFNSLAYLFLFLPITVCITMALQARGLRQAAIVWLLAASLLFYALWEVAFLPILLASAAFNYWAGRALHRRRANGSSMRWALAAAIGVNIGVLGVFKYADFFIANINTVTGTEWAALRLALPLGISFFTFTQIAFLVDVARGRAVEFDPLRYGLFVTFFPHLLAGPILHHRDMMPQFADPTRARWQGANVIFGVSLLVLGLAKKVLIADPLAQIANPGFAQPDALGCADAWLTALAYTFQLYFDFSGYCDMALGAARLINIDLPINFDAPYRALDLQEFWRRWHMTLSRFLRDYVYIPLGGNRAGALVTALALIATFTIGGFWHGANWTYIAWGALNGVGLVLIRAWRRIGYPIPAPLSWALTFVFCVFSWVLFRALSIDDALTIMRAMIGLSPHPPVHMTAFASAWQSLPGGWSNASWLWQHLTTVVGILALLVAIMATAAPTTAHRAAADWAHGVDTQPTRRHWLAALATGVLAYLAVINVQNPTEFIYFIF